VDDEHDSFLISVLVAPAVHSRRSADVYVGILMRAPSLQILEVEVSVDQHGGALDLLTLDLLTLDLSE